jgi:hypothetical protein
VSAPFCADHLLAVRLPYAEASRDDRVGIFTYELAEAGQRIQLVRLFGDRVTAPLIAQVAAPGFD